MKLTATFEVDVQFDIPEHLCATITKEDIAEMCASAVGHSQSGRAVQTVVDGVAQWTDMGPDYEKSDPVFSDVFVTGSVDAPDIRVQIEDDGFDVLEKQCVDD
jgi:hypothetical protein